MLDSLFVSHVIVSGMTDRIEVFREQEMFRIFKKQGHDRLKETKSPHMIIFLLFWKKLLFYV